MVDAAWKAARPEEEFYDDAQKKPRPGVEGQCERIGDTPDDLAEVIRYFTKHGDRLRQVSRQEWAGPLSGGDRTFYCASKKLLFRDDHYREEYDAFELGTLETQLKVQFPDLYESPAPAVADTPLRSDAVRPTRSLLDRVTPIRPLADSGSTVVIGHGSGQGFRASGWPVACFSAT
jgi:hypothetical protein